MGIYHLHRLSVPHSAAQEYYQDWSKDGKPSGKVANICLVEYALLKNNVRSGLMMANMVDRYNVSW